LTFEGDTEEEDDIESGNPLESLLGKSIENEAPVRA